MKHSLISLSVIVVCIVGFTTWYLWFYDSGEVVDDSYVAGVVVPDNTVPDSVPPLQVERGVVEDTNVQFEYGDVKAEELRSLVKVFVEAWGSPSYDRGYQNFDMASAYSTASMKSWLLSQKNEMLLGDDVHVITTVRGVTVGDEVDGRVEVQISASRIDVLDGRREFKQKANVGLVKVDDLWLIERAQWALDTF